MLCCLQIGIFTCILNICKLIKFPLDMRYIITNLSFIKFQIHHFITHEHQKKSSNKVYSLVFLARHHLLIATFYDINGFNIVIIIYNNFLKSIRNTLFSLLKVISSHFRIGGIFLSGVINYNLVVMLTSLNSLFLFVFRARVCCFGYSR